MWVLACLADMISYAGNDFIEFICLFIAPMCLLVKYAVMWISIHLYDKKSRLLKWIFQYGIFLGIWWLETYCIMRWIYWLFETDKWVTRNQDFNAGWAYGVWAWLAAIIPAIVFLMHILSTVIKRFSVYEVIHKIINILFMTGIVVTVYFGMYTHGSASKYYFLAIIPEALACFFFNWCYYKVE